MLLDQQSLETNDEPSAAVPKPAQATTLGPKIDLEGFLDGLALVNPSASILSTVLEHSDRFVPQSCLQELPKCLSTLYNGKYLDLPYHELLSKCVEVYDTLHASAEQVTKLEELTRKQANSKLWFRYRAGRVTASRFKAATSTNVAQPSQSLVKAICYPKSQQFKSSATW